MKNSLYLLSFLVVFSCVDPQDMEDMNVDLVQNIPVMANTSNAFSYVIRANDFSHQVNSSLNFDSTAFVVSLVIAEYSQGTIALAVYNEDSSQVYQQQISSNMVLADFPEFLPTALDMNLEDFSGSVTVSIAVE